MQLSAPPTTDKSKESEEQWFRSVCVRNDILTNPLEPLFFAVSCFTERCVSMKPGLATAGCYRAQYLKSHAYLIQPCISMLKMVMLNFLTTLNSYLQLLSLCCQDK